MKSPRELVLRELIAPSWCYSGAMADDDEVRLTLRLPRDLSERVEAAARADRRSKNAELVTLIEGGLACQASGKETGETEQA